MKKSGLNWIKTDILTVDYPNRLQWDLWDYSNQSYPIDKMSCILANENHNYQMGSVTEFSKSSNSQNLFAENLKIIAHFLVHWNC